MKNTDINAIIREIKEYQALQDDLKAQIDVLKKEAIAYLDENELEEYLCESGKITYREVISNKFNTTEFKKRFSDLYKTFTKQTSCMRFTCN